MTTEFRIHDTLKIRALSLHLFSQGLGYTFCNGGYETTFHPRFKRISTHNMIKLHNAYGTSCHNGKFFFLDKDCKAIRAKVDEFEFDAYFGVRATMSKIVDNCKFSVNKRGHIHIDEDSKQPNNNLVSFVSPVTKAVFQYWKD